MKEADKELIYKFLDNELEGKEIDLFKARHEQDPEFAKEVKLMSKIYISLQAASRASKDIISKKPGLRRFMLSSQKENKKQKSELRIFYRYAAVLLPIIAFGIVMVMITQPKTGAGDLYDSYYKAYEEPGSKGISDEVQMDFSSLLKDIDRGAQAKIDSLQNPGDYFYFGLYCMDHQRFNEAIYAFTQLIRSKSNQYREESEWFLGLCFLKTDNKEGATLVFTEIAATDGHFYQEESAELLGKLN